MGGRGASSGVPGPSGPQKKSPSGGAKPPTQTQPTARQIVEQYLGPKGTPKTLAETLTLANPNFSTGLNEWTRNCQRCIWAVELLRRGYDVEAMPKTPDRDYCIADETNPKSFVNVSTTPVDLHHMDNFFHPLSAARFQSEITSKNPEGARGMLIIHRSRGGHACNWEIVNGKVVIYDGQTGEKRSLTYFKKKGALSFEWGRMDDKDIAPLVQEFVKKRGT